MDLSRAEAAPLTGQRPRFDRAGDSLVGSQCARCGARSWPARAVCSSCGSDGLDQFSFPNVAELLSYTTVRVTRAGLPSPYVLGQIDLGHGAVLFAHVRNVGSETTVPATVRLVIGRDDEVPSFWFEPVAAGRDARG